MRFITSIVLGLSVLFHTLLATDAAAEVNLIPGTWAQSAENFGNALAKGDFNGDGIEDLAIGVSRDLNRGEVHVLEGSASGLRAARSLRSLVRSYPPAVASEFGFALGVGDFNGDGFDDLAVGAPGHSGNRGTVAVFLGQVGGLRWSRTILGPGTARRYGESFATDDFDNDGRDDLAVGAPGAFWIGGRWYPSAGSAWVQWRGGIGSNDQTLLWYGFMSDRVGMSLAVYDGGLAIGNNLDARGAAQLRVMTQVNRTNPGGTWQPPPTSWFNNYTQYAQTLTSGRFSCGTSRQLAVGIPGLDHHFGRPGGYSPRYNLDHNGNAGGVHIWRANRNYKPESVQPPSQSRFQFSRYGQVIGAGDFDDNNCDDLVLGLPSMNPSATATNTYSGHAYYRAGEVRVVFSGKSYVGGRWVPHTGFDEVVFSRTSSHAGQSGNYWSRHYQLDGVPYKHAELGSAVVAGDFDGDGYDDIAMGIRKDRVGTASSAYTQAGSVQVVYGGERWDPGARRYRPDFGRQEMWRQR